MGRGKGMKAGHMGVPLHVLESCPSSILKVSLQVMFGLHFIKWGGDLVSETQTSWIELWLTCVRLILLL